MQHDMFLEKVRLLETLVREAKKEDRLRSVPDDNKRVRESIYEALDVLEDVKDNIPSGLDGIDKILESFLNQEILLKKMVKKIDGEERTLKEEKEEREKREEKERKVAKEERERKEAFEAKLNIEAKQSKDKRDDWESKILAEIKELRKLEDDRKVAQAIKIPPIENERNSFNETIKIIQSQTKQSLAKTPRNGSRDVESAGTHIQTVVLGQCSGSITVIKTIQEYTLAVGFSSGEVGFYSLQDNFRFLHKFREHGGSITAMESGVLTMDDEYGTRNRAVLYTGGNERDMTVVVWDLTTFQPLRRLRGHDHMITGIVDIQDNETIATGSMDAKIAFWDLRGEEPLCIQLIEDMRFPIIVMEFDCDDGVLSVGTLDGQLGLWQVFLENEHYIGVAMLKILNLECHVLDILRVGSIPNTILTLESDFCIREYEIQTGRLVRTVKGDKPLMDLFLVESAGGKGLFMFTLDNSHNLGRIKDYTKQDSKVILPKTVEADGHVKRFIGYNPKSQILIQKDELFILAPDQTKQTISMTRLNLT